MRLTKRSAAILAALPSDACRLLVAALPWHNRAGCLPASFPWIRAHPLAGVACTDADVSRWLSSLITVGAVELDVIRDGKPVK